MHTEYKNECCFLGKALQCNKTNIPCKYYEKACPNIKDYPIINAYKYNNDDEQ